MKVRPVDEQRSTVAASSDTLEQFLADVEQRAFRMAMLATGNREDAHDIVQEAMYRLVKSYARHPGREWPMLFQRILQNAVRDWYRRQQVRSRLTRWLGWPEDQEAGKDPLEQVADPHASPLDVACDTDQRVHLVEQAVQALPLRQRQAFLLRAWEGMGVSDTATAMGCSEGSVKTHYSRAVHALRGQLEGLLDDEA